MFLAFLEPYSLTIAAMISLPFFVRGILFAALTIHAAIVLHAALGTAVFHHPLLLALGAFVPHLLLLRLVAFARFAHGRILPYLVASRLHFHTR